MLVYFFTARKWDRNQIGALDKTELKVNADFYMTLGEFETAWNDTDDQRKELDIMSYYIRIE